MDSRFCIICGGELTGRQRTLCSDECRRERKRRRQREYCRNNPEKIKENNDEYRLEHREELREYAHKYRQDNSEKVREAGLNYRQNNREKLSKLGRKYYWDSREKQLEHKREYYQDNREQKLEYSCNYWQEHREERNDYNHRYYRLSRGLPEDADLHKESSIERITREWLQENNIEFESQYYINLENSTYTKVDFYIPNVNVCLYCDGGYYHLFPNVKRCDENQNRILPQMGYKVIRMSEAEILAGNRPWDLI